MESDFFCFSFFILILNEANKISRKKKNPLLIVDDKFHEIDKNFLSTKNKFVNFRTKHLILLTTAIF